MHSEAVLLDGVRSPIGRLRGGLSGVRPDDLAAHVIKGLLARHPRSGDSVEEVVFGNTNQAGEDNRNVARMALLLAGLPETVTGVTVNRLCGSGLEAVVQASRAIRLGELELAIAGGVESMTRAPYSMPKSDRAFGPAPTVYDTSLGWRYPNPRLAERFDLVSMGVTAENVADAYDIDRDDQDAFALESHRRASAAWDEGRFADEVLPVPTPPRRRSEGAGLFARDESVRPDTSLAALAKLKPAFLEAGTVTAGNASPLNDGAAALLVASRAWAERYGVEPAARVVASATVGVHPNMMGTGPIPATRKALARAGLSVSDIGLVELNEAFAAQSLACIRALGLDPARVNVNGGATALGHPIGCSGARIVVTLLHEMRRREVRFGLATLCIGVGQGMALILERPAT